MNLWQGFYLPAQGNRLATRVFFPAQFNWLYAKKSFSSKEIQVKNFSYLSGSNILKRSSIINYKRTLSTWEKYQMDYDIHIRLQISWWSWNIYWEGYTFLVTIFLTQGKLILHYLYLRATRLCFCEFRPTMWPFKWNMLNSFGCCTV